MGPYILMCTKRKNYILEGGKKENAEEEDREKWISKKVLFMIRVTLVRN